MFECLSELIVAIFLWNYLDLRFGKGYLFCIRAVSNVENSLHFYSSLLNFTNLYSFVDPVVDNYSGFLHIKFLQ